MIEEATDKTLDEVLSLIKEYQLFYGVENINEKKNKLFFSQFISSHENGILHLYRQQQKIIGFTTIYKGFSSTRAETVAILNDLYIQPGHRGNGYGKALVNNAQKYAKSMGFKRLQWLTAKDNAAAQKLYDNLCENKSSWYFYAKEI